MDIRLRGKNWPTQKFLFCKTILDAVQTRVCSLVHSFAVCLRRDCLPVAGDKRLHQDLSGRRQIEVKIHGAGFLHLVAMTCAVQDIITFGFRAASMCPYIGFNRSTLRLELEASLRVYFFFCLWRSSGPRQRLQTSRAAQRASSRPSNPEALQLPHRNRAWVTSQSPIRRYLLRRWCKPQPSRR